MLKSLKRKKLHESVSEEVLKYIEEQGFNQGDRLPPERFFCEQFQVSRSSFREAMKKLESYGVIEIRPGSGMFLRSEKTILGELAKLKLDVSLEKKAIQEMLDLREMMEQYAIEQIVLQNNAACIERLSKIIDQYDRKLKNGDIPRHEDYMFHLTLYEGSGNSFLLNLFKSVKEMEQMWTERVINKLDFNIFGRDTEPLHRDIYEAMAKTDLKLAKRLMRKHFEILRKDLEALDHKLLP